MDTFTASDFVGALAPIPVPEGAGIGATRSANLAMMRIEALVDDHQDVAATVIAGHPDTDTSELCRRVLAPAASRGATVRVVCSGLCEADRAGQELARHLNDRGVVTRVCPDAASTVIVVGHAVAVVPRGRQNAARWSFVCRESVVNRAMGRFYEAWRGSRPLCEPDGGTLSRFERQVLAELLHGVKDEAAARALGVSSRTYRRYVTNICSRLGASSRFEAGARAVQLGWI